MKAFTCKRLFKKSSFKSQSHLSGMDVINKANNLNTTDEQRSPKGSNGKLNHLSTLLHDPYVLICAFHSFIQYMLIDVYVDA